MKIKVTSAIKSVLNTYAILFFSQNALLGAILLVVSFLNPIAGFSGLACTIFSLIITQVMGYRKEIIHAGIYSFNSLLMGFAFGSFFSFNAYYVVWLLFGSLMVIMITIIFEERLSGLGLPILSFPFIISFWLIVLAANSSFNTWLYHSKSDYWLHDAHIDTFPAYIKLVLPVSERNYFSGQCFLRNIDYDRPIFSFKNSIQPIYNKLCCGLYI